MATVGARMTYAWPATHSLADDGAIAPLEQGEHILSSISADGLEFAAFSHSHRVCQPFLREHHALDPVGGFGRRTGRCTSNTHMLSRQGRDGNTSARWR